MRCLRGRGGSILPTGGAARPVAEEPSVVFALQVIVASLDRTLSSDARTERALRLLRPILAAGVLTFLGIMFTVATVSTTDTWRSLIWVLNIAVVNMVIAILWRRRRKDPPPALVVKPIPRQRRRRVKRATVERKSAEMDRVLEGGQARARKCTSARCQLQCAIFSSGAVDPELDRDGNA
jgi:hypothetical protein